MSLRPFITNPYMEGIYASFLGNHSEEQFYAQLEAAVQEQLGPSRLEVLHVECGVGLAIRCRQGESSLIHLKVLKGTTMLEHQTECCRIQRYLAANDFPCTVPIGLPLTFADCTLQIEEHCARGEYRDSHDTAVMQLQAWHLARLHDLLKDYKPDNTGAIVRKFIPRDRVWQNPPQEVFRFDQSPNGDEFIQKRAQAAKAIFEEPHDRPLILSHEDWSNKHFRFVDETVSVIYDWDSLTCIDELYTIGLACSTFTATWYYPTKIFPTPEEAKAFVQAYSESAGRTFTAEERRIISSYAAYTLAYIARCVFAFDKGTLAGNPIEQPFRAIQNGQYF